MGAAIQPSEHIVKIRDDTVTDHWAERGTPALLQGSRNRARRGNSLFRCTELIGRCPLQRFPVTVAHLHRFEAAVAEDLPGFDAGKGVLDSGTRTAAVGDGDGRADGSLGPRLLPSLAAIAVAGWRGGPPRRRGGCRRRQVREPEAATSSVRSSGDRPHGRPLPAASAPSRAEPSPASRRNAGSAGPVKPALRHICASEEREAGESVISLARWLGHFDPGFTLRKYSHFLPRAGARGAAAPLSDPLGSRPDGERRHSDVRCP